MENLLLIFQIDEPILTNNGGISGAWVLAGTIAILCVLFSVIIKFLYDEHKENRATIRLHGEMFNDMKKMLRNQDKRTKLLEELCLPDHMDDPDKMRTVFLRLSQMD